MKYRMIVEWKEAKIFAFDILYIYLWYTCSLIMYSNKMLYIVIMRTFHAYYHGLFQVVCKDNLNDNQSATKLCTTRFTK